MLRLALRVPSFSPQVGEGNHLENNDGNLQCILARLDEGRSIILDKNPIGNAGEVRPDVTPINKKSLSEEDICTKYIAAVEKAGWDIMSQVRQQVYFTDGRIFVRGKLVSRGKGKKADYILYYKYHLPIAVIEAKDNKHSIGSRMQQGLDYGEIIDIPFVFSSNGDGFILHDRTVKSGIKETEFTLDEFPSPEETVAEVLCLERHR